jgi:signal transduction histidine kinase
MTAISTTSTTDPTPSRVGHVVVGLRRALRSVRTRVVVAYVLLLASALAVVTIVVRQVLLARVDREIEQSLVLEVEELRRLASGNDPDTGQPFGLDVRGIFDDFLARNVPASGQAFFTLVAGRPYASSAGAPAPLLDDPAVTQAWAALREPERDTVATAAGSARVLAVPLLGPDDATTGTFVVSFFPAAARAEVGEAVRVVLVVSLVALVVSSFVAWSIAGRVVRPVQELAATSRRITGSDLTARFPIEGHDELAALGATFNDMLDRLETGFASQRAVLDDIAHELRTPITIVRGHLELLGDDPDEQRDTVALCLDELDRMGRYVNDLLVVAKARQPDFLKPEPLDVGELMDGLQARCRAIADRDWVVEAAPRPGRAWVFADPDRVTQAVINLAQNAAQHTQPGGRIGLGAAVHDQRLRLWVRDDGPGIDPAERDRLFLRFSRGAGSRAARPEGTGLGLAIVQAVAQAHGGRVEVASEPGHGALFTVVLPIDVEGAESVESVEGAERDQP